MKLCRFFLLILIASISLFNTSCDKENLDERPELPPLESIQMSFSDFDTQPAGTKGITDTYYNFVHSYVNVAFWNGVAALTTALPVAAYLHLLNQDPEYLGDSTWEWTYDFTHNDIDYIATLTGERISNEEFSMEMVIATAALPALGTKWFDGIVRYDHTHAEWNLYYSEGGIAIKALEVEWDKDFELNTSEITYTYLVPGQANTGSYITAGTDPALDYDAYYLISISTGVINIEWDTDTKAGRVKDPVYFEDSNWHCWNSYLLDIDCPVLK